MLRLRLNCRVTVVCPCVLAELMLSRPAMVENWRSSGVATAEAIVSGLAPGRKANTWMVGRSTFARSLTGRSRRSEEHTSELQSLAYLVCRLLLEKKKEAVVFSVITIKLGKQIV